MNASGVQRMDGLIRFQFMFCPAAAPLYSGSDAVAIRLKSVSRLSAICGQKLVSRWLAETSIHKLFVSG
jgi:hypothetical protein